MRGWSLVLLASTACGAREVVDNVAQICFEAPAALPGALTATVTATGGEERPHDGTCELDGAGGIVTLTTSFFYDRDPFPFSENAILTFSSATCAVDVDGSDPIVVTFAGQELEVPVDGAEHCFLDQGPGGGMVPTDTPAFTTD